MSGLLALVGAALEDGVAGAAEEFGAEEDDCA
jgi:hypothetical protein